VTMVFLAGARWSCGHTEPGPTAVETMRPLMPKSIAAPLARYAHGTLMHAGARIIRTSGQLGLADDGVVPDSVAEQAAICFANIRAILAEGGMGVQDICHISAWLTDRNDLPAYMAARDAFLGESGVLPASTLLLVAGFSRPEFKVEIEVMAATD
jgi:enamine deaminase RidA (YjgF/YER057c/UK114 family)